MDGTGKCPRILVVEDDPDQRQLLCEALTDHYRDGRGGSIDEAANGSECLSKDLSAFDVILLDYHLPDTSGLSLLDEIVARGDPPVILVTGENDSSIVSQAILHGAEDFVVKLGDYLFAIPALVQKCISQRRIKKENLRLQRQVEETLQELQVKNRQLEETLATVQALATTDPLTGLANRRRFVEVLEHYYGEACRYRFDLTCLMCDLDQYKELNDAFGHQVGDDVLVIAADVIRSSLRSSDVAARYGGDEFILLLPHTSLDRGLAVGERIRQQLSFEARRYEKARIEVTMCIGMSSLRADRPDSADALVSLADRALYVAKDRGKDCIVAWHDVRSPAAKA